MGFVPWKLNHEGLGMTAFIHHHFRRFAFLVFLTSGTFSLQAQPLAQDPVNLERLSIATFAQYLEFLALPNDANVPANIQKNATWLELAFKQRGFEVQSWPNQGRPMVFAQWPHADEHAPSVLFYMHLDGQPVVPAEWSQPNPWQPVVKAKDANGQWVIVPTERLFTSPLNPDLRVFARSASDDKAPIMMLLAAFDGLRQGGRQPSVRVKVLIDSQEEQGSPTIPNVVNDHRGSLQADAIVILDGPQHASGKPTLIFGNRGALRVTLTVFGPKAPLHSGHYGNYVPNPAMRMAQLLASMKDDQGRVTIEGYYDSVQLTDQDRKVLAETGDDEVQIRNRVGIAKPERVAGTLQESLQYPSLNIRGMASASVGAKASNIIPDKAIAEFDLRTTPETPPERLFELLRQHIQRMGYHLVDGPPSDEERQQHDKIAWLEMGKGGKAVRTPMNSAVGRWTQGVLQSGAGSSGMVRMRMMGGSVPTDALVDILDAPFVIMPLVNGDNNQHTFDENMRIGHYVQGVDTIMRLLTTSMPSR
jgi:acetylornithine deacetylase/succinyl-diaminopimelate desuccinylase-like protein